MLNQLSINDKINRINNNLDSLVKLTKDTIDLKKDVEILKSFVEKINENINLLEIIDRGLENIITMKDQFQFGKTVIESYGNLLYLLFFYYDNKFPEQAKYILFVESLKIIFDQNYIDKFKAVKDNQDINKIYTEIDNKIKELIKKSE
ncbi:MAG: hypothetical protein ACP5LH_02360 [Candidatus Micrarchaeia archaeon]